jgi:hypothetical protein
LTKRGAPVPFSSQPEQQYIGDRRAKCTPIADFSRHADPYRTHLKKQTTWPYAANLERADLRHIREAFDEFSGHMSVVDPGKGIERNKRWTTNWYGMCSSRDKYQATAERFFGWAMLPPSTDERNSGLGLAPSELSFGMLGSFELISKFREFNARRSVHSAMSVSKDPMSGETRNLLATHVTLTHPRTGWLTQTEHRWLPALNEVLQKIESGTHHPLTEGYFTRQYAENKEWKRRVKPQFKKARDPRVTLERFLAPHSPMEKWIFPLIRNMQADKPLSHDTPMHRFYAERDLITIVAFFSIPLRATNWRLCELGRNLFRNLDGKWAVKLTQEEFKNRAHLEDTYSILIPDWAQPFFDHYVDNVLPIAGRDGNETQWLMPSMTGKSLSADALSRAFARIFERYFGFTIRPHAARHIVATDYLKDDPRNVEVVAVMLNDDPTTVRKEYAHLLKQDLAQFYNAFICEKAARILAPV